MADTKVFSKRKLEVVQILELKPYGQKGKSLLPLQAKDLSLEAESPLSGKPVRFVVFTPELQEYVKALAARATFVADYEEKERTDNPEYPPDRNIVQVYDKDGKPLTAFGKKGGASGGNYGRSPESIQLEYSLKAKIAAAERTSIEGQSAIAQVALLISNDRLPTLFKTPEDALRIMDKLGKALEKSLDNFLKSNPDDLIKSITAPVAGSATGKAQDKQGMGDKPPAVSTDKPTPPEPFKNVGDLLTRAGKLTPPVTRVELLQAMKLNDTTTIKDLDAAWKVVQEIHGRKMAVATGTDGKTEPTEDTAWAALKSGSKT